MSQSKATKLSGDREESATSPAPAIDAAKRTRGRPTKRDPEEKTFGMTLRVPGSLRLALRRAAERETDAEGKVVSVHDVILAAVKTHLASKGVKVGN